jgi:AraC-like DNA-binding protein
MGYGDELSFAPTPSGHERRDSRAYIPRHRHRRAYAALVLAGSYEESGSRGRFRVSPGDVLLHDAFDDHLDRFDSSGARIFSLEIEACPADTGIAHVRDADAVVRIAERDTSEAGALLLAEIRRKPPVHYDWPDILADELLRDPAWRLDEWARKLGLAPSSVSRGFRKVFGVTPAAFRLGARARNAFRMITANGESFAAVAATTGFADQAHMSRAIRVLTGAPPGSWRGSSSFKTGKVPQV